MPRRTSHRSQHDPHDGHPPPRRTPPHPAPPLRARARAPTTVINATRPPVRPAVAHPAPPERRPPSLSVRPSETPGRRSRATQNPDRNNGRGLFRIGSRYSRTRGHGVSRLRPQILLGAIRLDLAVHEEPADGGQCDQKKLLHRATSSFLDVGDLWRPTIHTDRYRSVTCVRALNSRRERPSRSGTGTSDQRVITPPRTVT